MTINIEFETDNTFEFDATKVISDVINCAIDYENCPYEAVVEVTITDNENIHRLNKEFRQVDRPTDVLSFPAIEYEQPGNFDFLDDETCECDYFEPDSGELILGDIVLSVDKIKEQAAEYNHSVKRELAFLVAHSMLHLFGYDHMTEDEAKIMEAKQEAILDILGITREII